MMGKNNIIHEACSSLGIDDKSYRLFTAVLTKRSYDDVVKSKSDAKRSQLQRRTTHLMKKDRMIEHVILKSYAQRFLPMIIQMLDTMPREMILLLKMNECIRHLHHTLTEAATAVKESPQSGTMEETGSSGNKSNVALFNSVLISGKYAARALREERVRKCREELASSSSSTQFIVRRIWVELVLMKERWYDYFWIYVNQYGIWFYERMY
jgi:hypothetical protein